VVKCGLLLAVRKTSNGFGWHAYIETKEIIGVYVGERSRQGAEGLWQSLPPLYRQCAVCYTDFWAAYNEIFAKPRHQAVGKKAVKLCEIAGGNFPCNSRNLIERFNSTLKQRVSRPGRKTLSFSKKLENHIKAIWYFIHHYNELCAYLELLFTLYPYLFRTTLIFMT